MTTFSKSSTPSCALSCSHVLHLSKSSVSRTPSSSSNLTRSLSLTSIPRREVNPYANRTFRNVTSPPVSVSSASARQAYRFAVFDLRRRYVTKPSKRAKNAKMPQNPKEIQTPDKLESTQTQTRTQAERNTPFCHQTDSLLLSEMKPTPFQIGRDAIYVPDCPAVHMSPLFEEMLVTPTPPSSPRGEATESPDEDLELEDFPDL